VRKKVRVARAIECFLHVFCGLAEVESRAHGLSTHGAGARQTLITSVSSFTAAADFLRAASSSGVSLI
jgi:hypothetical protein